MLCRHSVILAGGLLISLGINLFLTPHRLLDGGMIGLALILRYLWGMKTGFSMIMLSLPIFLAVWMMDRRMFLNSFYGMLVSAWLIDWLSPLRGTIHWPILFSALSGGLLVGTGVGLMLRFKTCTGGTDLLAQLIADRYQWNPGILIFLIDAVIIGIGSFILTPVQLFHTFLTISAVGLATSICVKKPQAAL
ncbi:putative 5xTM membrane YitT family protein [Melghirimyces profundicolus]|uniref:Putative 5xTM membrane YitT family protein n=1 Tax=Melghirimyces profundicolus TaxID=1242148 RepID=A0A2T6BQS5_9BACL|nr:YitT family protein [Melghirimyces profundicolus]PTX58453.1 putative 5xTM membrane YitT family protein [Melghirimyces profundicolus]